MMARLENDRIVKKPISAKDEKDFASLKKAATHQSPVSTTYEDATKYPKSKGK